MSDAMAYSLCYDSISANSFFDRSHREHRRFWQHPRARNYLNQYAGDLLPSFDDLAREALAE
jgi:hypothetical protein